MGTEKKKEKRESRIYIITLKEGWTIKYGWDMGDYNFTVAYKWKKTLSFSGKKKPLKRTQEELEAHLARGRIIFLFWPLSLII